MVIDNDTWQVVDDPRSDRIARIAAYESEMNKITNSDIDNWVTSDMYYRSGKRQGPSTATRHGGAYADAEKMVRMGYAIGCF